MKAIMGFLGVKLSEAEERSLLMKATSFSPLKAFCFFLATKRKIRSRGKMSREKQRTTEDQIAKLEAKLKSL